MGYKALNEEGYNTRWLRVSSKKLDEYLDRLKTSVENNDSVFYGRIDFLYDSEISSGLERLADEGFSEEILYDYAHQMSKR